MNCEHNRVGTFIGEGSVDDGCLYCRDCKITFNPQALVDALKAAHVAFQHLLFPNNTEPVSLGWALEKKMSLTEGDTAVCKVLGWGE